MENNVRLPEERLLVGKPLLLVIDVQHDFMDLDAPCYNLGAESTIAPIARLIERFRESRLPIIFTRERHRADRLDAGLESDPFYNTPPHTIENTTGFEIIDELAPLEDEIVIDKRRYSSFLDTELERMLHLLAVETIVICGVSSDVCVHWTAGDAFQRDYHVRVVEDCTAGLHPADHAASLLVLRNLCSGGRLILSDDIVGALVSSRWTLSP